MGVATYDPKDIIVTLGGVPLSGFADGTFVTVSRSGDSFSKSTGADGRTSRAKSNDKSGELALVLAQTSLSNDVLSAMLAADEASGAGVVPLMVKDVRGAALWFSPSAWIRKPADGGYGKEISDREWMIDCADLQAFVGGVATA